jgi:hypothetical protein
LHDGVFPGGNSFDPDHRDLLDGFSRISRKFRHRLAGPRGPVLRDAEIWDELSLDDEFRAGDAFLVMVRHWVSSTGLFRMPPATESSLKPNGVVGASKQEAIAMAGSTPMLMEIGSGRPSASAFCRKISKWRAPGTKYMEIRSLSCRQSL